MTTQTLSVIGSKEVEPKYLMVGDNGKWTTEPQTKEQIIDGLSQSGVCKVTFQSSRRTDEYEFLKMNGSTVGKLFSSKANQVKYLHELGLI